MADSVVSLETDDDLQAPFRELCDDFNSGRAGRVTAFTKNYENRIRDTRWWKPYVLERTKHREAGKAAHVSRLEAIRAIGLPMPDMELLVRQTSGDAIERLENQAKFEAQRSDVVLYPREAFCEPEVEPSADDIFDWVMRNIPIKDLTPADAPCVMAWAVLQRFRTSPDLYDRMLEKWLSRKSEDERRKREEQVSGLGSRTGRPGVADDGMTLDKLLTTARSRK